MEYLIIGSGIAGVSAAKEILKRREKGDSITIISDEPYPFYYRPRLIECLSGKVKIEELIIHQQDWFSNNGILLRLGEKAEAIDPELKEVKTDKASYSYDKLLLANGAYSFIPPIKGVKQENIFTLRKGEDALEISRAVQEAKQAVVVGGGLLGLEAAFNLRQAGLEVTVVEVFDWLLPRQLDEPGGRLLQRLLEAKGLNFYLGVQTREFLGKQRVTGLRLSNGEIIAADLVLLSTGARAHLEIFKDLAGLKTDKGVLVNEYMETSLPDIYAAGDVSSFQGRFYGTWKPALEEGRIAGINMSSEKKKAFLGAVPAHKLKVVGIDVVSMGELEPDDQSMLEIRKEEGGYQKIIKGRKGEIRGLISIGHFDNTEEIIKILNKR